MPERDRRFVQSVDIFEVGEFKRDERGDIVLDDRGEPIWIPPPLFLKDDRFKPE